MTAWLLIYTLCSFCSETIVKFHDEMACKWSAAAIEERYEGYQLSPVHLGAICISTEDYRKAGFGDILK